MNFTGTLAETSTSLIIENLVDPPPAAGADLSAQTQSLTDNGSNASADPVIPAPTPEPTGATLLALGITALLARRPRRA